MNFSISAVPATLAGSRTIRQIEPAAHENDPIGPLLWPSQLSSDPEPDSVDKLTRSADIPSLEEEEAAREIAFLQDPSNHYLLVTELAAEKAVAYVWWQQAKGRTSAQWAETYANRYRPKEMNKALMDATSGVRFLKRAKILGEQDVFILKELYVRPEFQRRGLGGKLVAWGVQKADELGLLSYTEASPKGLGLYLKHGFLEVDRVTVDLEPWGGKKGDVSSYRRLLRKPQENA
ncbi:hypothetical protein MMC11_002077 [Xylographa trunciseda]|nr:hypothetical protein [Xylographa trunciseda]